MQQTVSLIAGMTKVFKSANINQQYQEICECQKENHKGASQNKELIQEIPKKNGTKVIQKENILNQIQLQRR